MLPPRGVLPKLAVAIAVLTFVHLTTNLNLLAPLSLFSSAPPPSHATTIANTCPPDAWAAGNWAYNPRPRVAGYNDTPLARSEDIFKYNGMRGCAADREFYWHLAADNANHWARFPAVTEWDWVPGEGCEGVAPLTPEALVKDLVENGSWLVLGDSVTENHFFSLSCSLFPHVRATPNYTENPYFDRAWPQHLYLHPDSPLVHELAFPDGFSIEHTPLVTFRRIDLLLSRLELEELHHVRHPETYAADPDFKLFSEEQHWTHSPAEYMAWFTAPAPMRYATLIANTAGHWTTTLLAGFRDEQASADGYGIQKLVPFFGEAMDRWAKQVQGWMDAERERERLEEVNAKLRGVGGVGGKVGRSKGGLKRQVLVRAYLPGHEDCHDWRAPWTEWHPFRWNWYNWAWIGDMNREFETVLASPAYPDLHYLPIDRPALLRPDAHGTGDCLHLMSGSGVMEGWTRYMWHYVRTLGGRADD
ncbi:hypothetical protein OF83DRAFT_1082642 [Amylostereum chailletii]|nr:hypothetical protein OF83DRAFT_1082642 [Amylostereum chailletii]